MNINQNDLVLLPVPFSDQTSSKVRPAIVVSNNHINQICDDVMLVPLTSILKQVPYSINITQKELITGKLIAQSRARVDKLFTAHKSLIRMKIGSIKPEVLELIKQEISKAVN